VDTFFVDLENNSFHLVHVSAGPVGDFIRRGELDLHNRDRRQAGDEHLLLPELGRSSP
jgi:hypothetical protein